MRRGTRVCFLKNEVIVLFCVCSEKKESTWEGDFKIWMNAHFGSMGGLMVRHWPVTVVAQGYAGDISQFPTCLRTCSLSQDKFARQIVFFVVDDLFLLLFKFIIFYWAIQHSWMSFPKFNDYPIEIEQALKKRILEPLKFKWNIQQTSNSSLNFICTTILHLSSVIICWQKIDRWK